MTRIGCVPHVGYISPLTAWGQCRPFQFLLVHALVSNSALHVKTGSGRIQVNQRENVWGQNTAFHRPPTTPDQWCEA